MRFVWNGNNIDHLAKHAVTAEEAELIVESARRPYPEMIGEDKRLVIGQLPDGRYLQVIYVPSRSVPNAVYIMHSRPLTDGEKRRFRRRTR